MTGDDAEWDTYLRPEENRKPSVSAHHHDSEDTPPPYEVAYCQHNAAGSKVLY